MAVATRLIRRRITSIRSTRKITKAMELVSASKMRKCVQLAVTSRAYADAARVLVDQILHLVDPGMHQLLLGYRKDRDARARTSSKKTIIAVCASDRGLCGGFNAQELKKTIEFVKGREGDHIEIVSIGRRAERALGRAGLPIIASFEAISNAPSFARSAPMGKLLVDSFISGRADRVFISYMKFEGAMKQVPTVEQILPIIPEEQIGASGIGHGASDDNLVFEPDPSAVLDRLLPKLVETRIYQALLESSASEHSARMMAMRSATDSATTMLDDLTLAFNQARQAGITQEISEISAGKAAIE
jgi:F-type H+-transporting ATPase subunit gamma